MHVVTTRRTYKGRVYETHLLRRSYREDGRVKNETLGNLSHLPAPVVDLVRRALRGETFVPVAARASICGTQKSIAITVCSLASISAVGMADWLPLQHRQSGEHQAALHPGGMPQS